MEIKVGVTLNNQSPNQTTVNIPAGTIFEAAQTEHGVQNVTIAKGYTFKIPPFTNQKVIVIGRCLNSSRATPEMNQGKLTPFKYIGQSFEQQDIWHSISNPKS